MTDSVAIFTKAAQMLAEADTIQKTKELKDLALTARDWAIRKGLGEDAVRHAQNYALRAERKMGEMLKDTERARPAMGSKIIGNKRVPMKEKERPTLAELGLSKRESSRAQLIADLPEDAFEEIENGNITAHEAIKKVKIEKKKDEINAAREKIATEAKSQPTPPLIIHGDSSIFDGKCDLLITDPPYMTDIDDIHSFAKWLPEKLKCVKDTGFAFVFIGAYPEELNAYLNVAMPEQVLVWTYRNTLGAAPKNKYKLNWQAILFYRMANSPALDCPLTNELWAVQDINAPDGRHEGRYHSWEKPMKLAERLIRHTTKEDDTILDCFAGTGTFLLAGAKLGRKTIGYEIDKTMIDIAEKRGCKIG